MRKNRIISLIIIIGFGIFASYYGGNVSYALFYLSLLVPLVAFLYTLYVYSRFKIYQSMDSYKVVKGDWNDYSFVIGNEDFLSYQNIKVKFFSKRSTIDQADQIMEYSLIPGESKKLESRLKANYRGEYEVGIESVEVTDFLYLFSITYPLLTRMRLVALPRVIELDNLSIAPPQVDVKNPIFSANNVEEELDAEVRKYQAGDNKKRIHWKASAKLGELVSRKYHYRPKANIALYMDLIKVDEGELETIIIEDKIIESVLAIANYYTQRGIPSKVIYDDWGMKNLNISSQEDFEAFYNSCARIDFEASIPPYKLISAQMSRGEDGTFILLATHLLTEELYLVAQELLSNGSYFTILFISDDLSEESKTMVDELRSIGAMVYQVMLEDEISHVIG